MKMSIIIPVYNVEKYLDECLTSVCNQTLKEIEIICINDCSTDLSHAILEKWAKIDKRIVILNNHINGGLSYSRNLGLRYASGEYVYFVDSDDYLYDTDILERGYNYLKSNLLDGLLVDADVIYEDGVYTNNSYSGIRKNKYCGVNDGPTLAFMLWKNKDIDTPVWRQLWDRGFLTSNQLWFEDGIIHEDFLFTIKAVLTARKLMCVNEIFYTYRKRANSITQSNEFEKMRFYSYIRTYYETMKFLEDKNFPQKIGMFIIDWLNIIAWNIRRAYLQLRREEKGQDDLFKTILQKIIWNHAWKEKYKYLRDGIGMMDFELISGFKYLIVYGAGKIGEEIVDLLSEYDNFRERIRIAVTEKDAGGILNGISINWIGDYKRIKEQCVIIVAVSKKNQDAVMKVIKKYGFPYYINTLVD